MDYLIPGAEYLARFKDFKLVGRECETDLLSSILIRKRSNSVLLVGPSGVGATALLVGLQAMKADPDVPFDIVSKRLFWLNTDDLFSSGNTEQITVAFNAAINRLKNTIDPVLIIEDSGDFYEACRNAGTSHFINIINSAVKDGKLQAIFEVSDHNMTKIATWHSDFTESYTTMDLTEPVGEALVEITKAAATKLSDFHKIKIDEDAVMAAVELTTKYRVDNGLGVSQPTRAISLLDRTFAGYRLSAHKLPPHIEDLKAAGKTQEAEAETLRFTHMQGELKVLHRRMRETENKIAEYQDKLLEEERAQAEKGRDTVIDSHFSSATFDTPEMSRMRQGIDLLKEQVLTFKTQFDDITKTINESLLVTRKEILKEFSRITGISANKLGEDEKVILRNLETNLRAHVFGQDHVLVQVADAVKVSRVGRRNKSKPQASFLMMGPSGVGKTEVAKRLTEAMKGDMKALLRFDMSEYMERHAVSKLIGAPPGYEGFEAGGILTNAMRINRDRIILFDEIEKAHPDVFNLFLQILDDGRLTDNVGRVADFSESTIIMTTNIGQPHFLNMELDFETATELAKKDLDETYRPEFLNRFNGRQNIVCFNRLELDSIVRIVCREISDLAKAYESQGVEVVVSTDCIQKFCEEQYDARTGARGLPGFIIARLEPQITNLILDGKTGRFEFVYKNKTFELK